MPKRNVTQISHSALTNHRIPVREGQQQVPLAPREIEGLILVDEPGGRSPQLSKITLLRAYRQLSSKNNEYRRRYLNLLEELGRTHPEDTFVQAALGDEALAENRTEEAVSHLKRALPEGDPAIYLELGQALGKLGRTEDAIEFLEKGVEKYPYNAVMQKTLILQYINVKSYPLAQRLMQQYVADFPEDSFMRNLLSRVSQ
jgi:predicted Zn-dependent protease